MMENASKNKKLYHINLTDMDSRHVDDMEKNKLKNAEFVIRQFLFENSDSVRLTNAPFSELRFSWNRLFYFKKYGNEDDQKFSQLLNDLKSDLIKKEESNEKYQTVQPREQNFKHYYFRLSEKIKELISGELLVWNYYEDNSLYCLEDPVFFKDDEMIGYVISHEQDIFLNLSPEEKCQLDEEGIVLKEVEDL